MKKTMSVFIAIVMMFSVICIGALPASASEQWEPRPYAQDTLGCVNGEVSGDIYYSYDAESNVFTYTYSGNGTVTDWQLPLLEEGKDYEVVSKDSKFTIKMIDGKNVIPYVNALVNFGKTEITTNNQNNHDVVAKVSNSSSASAQWEPRPYAQDTLGCVNGEVSGDIHYSYDAELNAFTYTYSGNGKVTDWQLPLLEEGKDYEVVSKGSEFTIKMLDGKNVIPYVNALVDFEQTEIVTNNQNSNAVEETSKTSPKTGSDDKQISIHLSSAVALTCVAVLSAVGILYLIAVKKKKSGI